MSFGRDCIKHICFHHHLYIILITLCTDDNQKVVSNRCTYTFEILINVSDSRDLSLNLSSINWFFILLIHILTSSNHNLTPNFSIIYVPSKYQSNYFLCIIIFLYLKLLSNSSSCSHVCKVLVKKLCKVFNTNYNSNTTSIRCRITFPFSFRSTHATTTTTTTTNSTIPIVS